MRNDRTEIGRHLSDHIEQLASDLRQFPASEPGSTFASLCDRLSNIAPFSSVGVFRTSQPQTSLEWLHLSGTSSDYMSHTLLSRRDDLISVLDPGKPIQFGATPSSEGQDSFFVGIPAGIYYDAPLGIGLSSSRELTDDEITRLMSFGTLVGLIAENIRLRYAKTRQDDVSETARLIGYIAHELRTPLTGIRGNIQLSLMAARKDQHDRVPARLEAAIKSVDAMATMIQKLLDVSRLERGAFTVTLAMADLGSTVQSATDQYTTTADGAVSVQFDPTSSPVIEHDQAALQQAIAYLLEIIAVNTGEGGAIVISMNEEGSAVRVALRYSGQSLAESDIAVLSASKTGFLAADAAENGISLDLAFTGGIVRNHDGQITVYSDSPSTGQHLIELRLPRIVN